MGLLQQRVAEEIKPYTEGELRQLQQKYTPEQLEALRLGEESISLEDLLTQAAIRQDHWKFKYLDDFSQILPVIDKPIRAPDANTDANIRVKSDDDIAASVAEFMNDEGPRIQREIENKARQEGLTHEAAELSMREDQLNWWKFKDDPRTYLKSSNEQALLNPRSSEAPALPKIEDPNYKYPKAGEEVDPNLERLMKQTGLNQRQIRNLRTKHLVDHRVVNQTRMGKIQSQYFLTVAGNGDGMLGIGEGKSTEPEDARRQAMYAAIRNMVPILRYEGRTIFGEVEGKVGGTEVLLSAREPGKEPMLS